MEIRLQQVPPNNCNSLQRQNQEKQKQQQIENEKVKSTVDTGYGKDIKGAPQLSHSFVKMTILKFLFICRHSAIYVASRLQSSVHSYMSRSLYGTYDCIWICSVPPKIPGNTIQFGQKPGKRVHRINSCSGSMYWDIHWRMFPETFPIKAKGCSAICTYFKYRVFMLLRFVVFLGLWESENGWNHDPVL